METFWFWVVAVMLALYVVLDGFDLGAGIVHLYAARNDEERRLVLQTIGHVWDGNEVWLLAAAGTLYLAFPAAYASSLSGFYLPLMVVLWLFMFRGISLEFRHHFDNGLWRPFWDVTFSVSSALLAVFLGAALGNVLRGVPLDEQARFFLPLWTDFQVGPEPGILDWYTMLVGLGALMSLTQHGALWVAYKATGDVHVRALRAARAVWWGVLVFTVLVTIVTFFVQAQVPTRLLTAPWGLVFPGIALLGLFLIPWFERWGAERNAFLASSTYLIGMMVSAAFGVYPYVLPSNVDPARGLDVYEAAAGAYGLVVGLAWFIPGMALVAAYFVFTYRRLAGKVRAEQEGY